MFMSENVLATWEVATKSQATSVVVPDGCRDLILFSQVGNKNRWFVTPLFDEMHKVVLSRGSMMIGFRMRPGIRVAEKKLLESMPEQGFDWNEIRDRLDTFTTRKDSVEEALNCLASDVKTVAQVAKEIGTVQRTLQRLLLRETGRSPVYWMMLARARKAARALSSSLCLVDIAELHGYADQAHMSREFKRWFNTSPSALRTRSGILHQVFDAGYDGTDTGVHISIKKPFMSAT